MRDSFARFLIGLAGSALVAGGGLILITLATRAAFDFDRPWMHDLSLWLHGLAVMIGLPAAMLYDRNVRIDLFYQRAAARIRRWFDRGLTLCLFLPAIALLLVVSTPYAWRSLVIAEESAASDGMPGLFLIKIAMVLTFALMALIGLWQVIRPNGRQGD